MVEDKKDEAEKSSPKPKATAGAWWKSTVVEEGQQTDSEQAADAKGKAGEENAAEKTVKQPAKKRSPRKKAPSGDEAPTIVSSESSEESTPVAKTPRKRAPRKKKEAVEVPEGVDAAGTVQSSIKDGDISIDGISSAENADEVVTPKKRQPRKRPARKKTVTETVAAESAAVPSVPEALVAPASTASAAAPSVPEAPVAPVSAEPVVEQVEAVETVAEGETVSAPKRTPRKRPPRKKKPAVVVPVEAVDQNETVLEGTSAGEETSTEEQKEAAVSQPVDGQTEPVKRSPRKRSHRKRKSSGGVATESVSAVPVAAESTGQIETAALSVEVEGGEVAEVAEVVSAVEEVEGEAGQERKKRRPANRRSRGRRKGPVKQAEAPVVVEEELDEDDDEEAWSDFDDDDFDEDDELESRPGRDRRDSYRSGVTAPEGGAEFPALPDDEESEDKENIVLKLLINAEEPEECRLALLENGRLESIHVSTINRAQTKNNIYKARIVAIEPNLQAAFIDYGTEKNGFLPFSEIHPEYYKEDLSADIQKLVESHHWKKLSITDVVEKGQDVMVQVVKEEVGKKGANMTTYLSLPGRSVVLMPGSDSSGISRKISGEERRAQLRTAMNSLGIPEGIGWIVRTAGVDITRSALARDVGYLLRLWEEIKKKAQDMSGVGQVYEDHQSVLRFLREHFDPAIEEILVDDEDAMEQVKEFISLLPSKQRDVKVRLHKGSRPIFNQYSIEDQIESIYQPRVSLPSGGSIVIEPTEALVSIDVNSGSTSKGKSFDQSIYQANLEAAGEIGRQLRLRDLGGLIVVDFIDMRNKKHIRDVERVLKQSMRRDKAKLDFSRISKFGLMQISRQKLGSPIEAGNYRVCEHCKGRGTVRSVETLALFYLRRIQTGASRNHVGRVECHFPLDVAQYLLNKKRHEILEHETRYDTEIVIVAEPSMSPADHEITLHKAEKEPIEKKQG